MVKRKKKTNTFDSVYLSTLMLSSFILPTIVARNVDLMSGTIVWCVTVFLTLDFYLRTSKKHYIKRKKTRKKNEEQKILDTFKQYRKA